MPTFNTEYEPEYVKPGRKIYVIVNDTKYDDKPHAFIDEDEAMEVDYIARLSDKTVEKYNLTSTTAWWYFQDLPNENIVGYEKETPENPWGFKKLPREVLDDAEIINQFIWTKKHQYGHAEPLGDILFLSKEEAEKGLKEYYSWIWKWKWP
jgi:hypothetical protein